MKSTEPLSRNRDPKLSQTEQHVNAICCRLYVNDDVISGQNIKTGQGSAVINVEGASFSTFLNIPKRSFCDVEVGDGSGGMNATCSRPEVADDVISGIYVDTFFKLEGCYLQQFWRKSKLAIYVMHR